ncbi:glycosyltransferase family 4 protein [Cyanothece sp. BG0011]|uniref:glycosyltransferase family 4 protein n=1 Tax=Cyanothece sp. BG0011 TaxID=2082950 RepID=UPI000D1FA373|nr:glycosyltransferase family 4 protein [Cyanothece sp. BG0011]
MNKLNVGFFSAKNYLDRMVFSGTLYKMHESLHSVPINLINLGNPQVPKVLGISGKIWRKLKGSFLSQPPAKNAIAPQFRQLIQEQLQHNSLDLILAPVACQEMQYLETDIPIIYLSDVTHKLLVETYQLDYTQQKEECEASRCCLLFIGRNWERKGGKLAFETLTSLLEMGVDAELLVIGCSPPPDYKHQRLRVIPYLDKNIPEQREKFNHLLLKSHFLIFPTRADCSPIVICEANAYGIPVMTTDVGGIPTIIKEGKNGFMLSLSASGQDYAELIKANFSDTNQYQNLVKSSRGEYDTRLNWQTWAERLYDIMLELTNVN